MKRFMYFSIGALCLSIAALIGFHMGSRTAEAQAGSVIVGTFTDSGSRHYVILQSGDVYSRSLTWAANQQDLAYDARPLNYVGNFWGEQPIPTAPSTLGGVKSKYTPKKP